MSQQTIKLKYVLEQQTNKDVNETKKICYLPIKIGEFTIDNGDSIIFNRSFALKQESDAEENSNLSLKDTEEIEVNVDVWSSESPLIFSGIERKDQKIDKLESEVKILRNKIDELTKRMSNISNENREVIKIKHNKSSPDIAYLYSVPLVKTTK